MQESLRTQVATFLPKVNEGMLTPCECEGNPPKGTWDLLQSPPVKGDRRHGTRE